MSFTIAAVFISIFLSVMFLLGATVAFEAVKYNEHVAKEKFGSIRAESSVRKYRRVVSFTSRKEKIIRERQRRGTDRFVPSPSAAPILSSTAIDVDDESSGDRIPILFREPVQIFVDHIDSPRVPDEDKNTYSRRYNQEEINYQESDVNEDSDDMLYDCVDSASDYPGCQTPLTADEFPDKPITATLLE